MARNAIESDFRSSKISKKIKVEYRSEMARNAIKIDFRSSKLAARGHFVNLKTMADDGKFGKHVKELVYFMGNSPFNIIFHGV